MIIDYCLSSSSNELIDDYIPSLCLILCSLDKMGNITEISTVRVTRYVFDRRPEESNPCGEISLEPRLDPSSINQETLRIKYVREPSEKEKETILTIVTGLMLKKNIKEIIGLLRDGDHLPPLLIAVRGGL